MLPPALIDYTFSRLSNLAGPVYFRRHLANAALALKPPTPGSEHVVLADSTSRFGVDKRPKLNGGALKVREGTKPSHAISADLARRVRELEKFTNEKDAELEPPFYSEMDLMAFYEDVLAHSDDIQILSAEPKLEIDLEAQYREDLAVVESIDQRLRYSVYEPSRLTMILREHAAVPSVHAETSQDGATPVHRRVVNQVQQFLNEIQPSAEDSTTLPLSLLSMDEWSSLHRAALHVQDIPSAETIVELMERSNLHVPEEYINNVLQLYVEDANYVGFESCLEKLVQGTPSEHQRHLHVKVHLKATPPDSISLSALSVLHAYENQSHPPAMKTYTTLIHHLFSVRNPISQAQAWDLFSHMRYVAHPTPDAFLYTQMIRACASPFVTSRSSDPERALDLWTEMTVDHRIPPHSGTWNAIILACARSGRKAYIHEAFRLAKEMLDSNRDAYGRPAYTPDAKTFCALLEGAKRKGDLGRARWILAEMAKSRHMEVEVNEEALMHVFHAYAAYKPPFKRNLARIVEGEPTENDGILDSNDIASTSAPVPDAVVKRQSLASFTHIPPQSSAEVIAEVELLFTRLMHEKGMRDSSLTDDDEGVFQQNGQFKGIELTTRLVNSYLSVHYRHNSLHTSRDIFWTVFEKTGTERDSRTYVEALERCAMAKKEDREFALRFAEDLFERWKELEGKNKEISPRMKERAHTGFIRILSLTENLDRAMSHLRSFVEHYPPSAIRDPNSIVRLSMRATRTALVGDRPLVRLTSETEIPDKNVPPLLTWKDLEVLHHRLVAVGKREKDIGYIKYVCKAYEWALRVRRDETMKARPET